MSSGVEAAIAALHRAVEAHSAGDYHELPGIFCSVESKIFKATASMDKGLLVTNLETTKNFLDSWADASNHDWLHYEGISKDDWPILASAIVESLELEKPIPSPIIVDYFQPKRRIGLFRKLFTSSLQNSDAPADDEPTFLTYAEAKEMAEQKGSRDAVLEENRISYIAYVDALADHCQIEVIFGEPDQGLMFMRPLPIEQRCDGEIPSEDRIRELARSGRIIDAIRLHRILFGSDLATAKAAVDKMNPT